MQLSPPSSTSTPTSIPVPAPVATATLAPIPPDTGSSGHHNAAHINEDEHTGTFTCSSQLAQAFPVVFCSSDSHSHAPPHVARSRAPGRSCRRSHPHDHDTYVDMQVKLNTTARNVTVHPLPLCPSVPHRSETTVTSYSTFSTAFDPSARAPLPKCPRRTTRPARPFVQTTHRLCQPLLSTRRRSVFHDNSDA